MSIKAILGPVLSSICDVLVDSLVDEINILRKREGLSLRDKTVAKNILMDRIQTKLGNDWMVKL